MRKPGTWRTLFGTIFLLWGIVIISTLESCVPPSLEEVPSEVNLNSKDSIFQLITDLQDRQEVAELYPWLRHRNPNYRYLAARAFASIQAEEAIDSLAALLQDPIDQVRAMAAFALGQSGTPEALPHLVSGFMQEDTALQYAVAQQAILEAVGKCGDLETLELLSTVEEYTPRDTALIEGQAYGIYRFGLQGTTSELGTRRMLQLIEPGTYHQDARLVAANYLMRINVSLDSFSRPLIQAFEAESNADIRMALAIALGKTRQESALTSLVNRFASERDYRVKCNILRALNNFPYENARALVTESIRDPNLHVARRAVQYLLENSASEDATLWWQFAKDSLPSSIRLDLYRAANRHLPVYLTEYRNGINSELRRFYRNTTSPYEQAAALRALAEFGWNFRFIYRESIQAEHPTVRSAGIECLQYISERADFSRFFGGGSRQVERELASYFQEAIRTLDAGPVAIAAQALRSEERDYRSHIDSIGVLQRALDSLELPTMIESYNALAETIAFLTGDDEFTPKALDFNHPIDWTVLDDLSTRPKVSMQTDEGTILLELWPEQAPGTVANFVKLAQDGFFDGKNFHRVVANFVIQGGCPRGDGYGSLDYSIRSEFTPVHYREEGIIGMASAGKHTEGTQFFITHSPTLHLDGRYTAFGRVIDGMEVVHRIQQADQITTITINN